MAKVSVTRNADGSKTITASIGNGVSKSTTIGGNNSSAASSGGSSGSSNSFGKASPDVTAAKNAVATGTTSSYISSGGSGSNNIASTGGGSSGTSGSSYSQKMPDMGRRKDLAGQTVYSNGMNVTYDENGYAVRATNVNHSNFENTDRAIRAQSIDTIGREVSNVNDLDRQVLSDSELASIDMIRSTANAGIISWAEANTLANEIRGRHGYSGGADGATWSKIGTTTFDPSNSTTQPSSKDFSANPNTDWTIWANGTYAGPVDSLNGGAFTPNQNVNLSGAGYAGTGAYPTSGGAVAAAGKGTGTGAVGTPTTQTTQLVTGSTGGTGGTGATGEDLSEMLKKINAAVLEKNLAALKDSYDKSMSGYNELLSTLPQNYNAARNATAAQDALSRRQFDERAIAAGLNSGASGQMELSRSSALQNALAGIDQQQQNATDTINTKIADLGTSYQNAIAKAQAEGDLELAQALYNEMVRLQEQQQDAAKASQEYQTQMAKLAAQYGDFSGLNALGINTSSFEAQLEAERQIAEQERLAAEEAKKKAENKPMFTISQVQTEIANARKNGTAIPVNVLQAYEYYYGEPYGGVVSDAQAAQAALAGGGERTGGGYNNGGLDNGTVAGVQEAWNKKHPDRQIAVDGYWGPNSQKVTGYGDAKTAQAKIASGEPAITGDATVDMNSVLSLGLGPISEETLARLVNSGQVEEYLDGNKIKFRMK